MVGDINKLSAAIEEHHPLAVICDLIFPEGHLAGVEYFKAINEYRLPPLPVNKTKLGFSGYVYLTVSYFHHRQPHGVATENHFHLQNDDNDNNRNKTFGRIRLYSSNL